MTEFVERAPVSPFPGPGATPVGHGRNPITDPSGHEVLDPIEVALEGGPADLPAELRNQRVASSSDKIKVRYYGGYEHFERDPAGAGDAGAAVFRWTGRTRIAE